MKTITAVFLIITAIMFTSCEGPMGPPGEPGQNGTSFLGSVFEIQDDFTNENNYTLSFQFPGNFEIYDTDIVLVYILWDQSNGVDIWRLLPQTVALKKIYPDKGWTETDILQYNYDYTYFDVQIYLEGTMDFSTLLPAETDNQVFRIVVLPADFVTQKSADINDLNSLLTMPGLQINANENISSSKK